MFIFDGVAYPPTRLRHSGSQMANSTPTSSAIWSKRNNGGVPMSGIGWPLLYKLGRTAVSRTSMTDS